jgi:hypothetical protein
MPNCQFILDHFRSVHLVVQHREQDIWFQETIWYLLGFWEQFSAHRKNLRRTWAIRWFTWIFPRSSLCGNLVWNAAIKLWVIFYYLLYRNDLCDFRSGMCTSLNVTDNKFDVGLVAVIDSLCVTVVCVVPLLHKLVYKFCMEYFLHVNNYEMVTIEDSRLYQDNLMSWECLLIFLLALFPFCMDYWMKSL